jgi:PHP family Zn ribbon phosphoesterase
VEDVKKIDSSIGSIIEKFRNDKLMYISGGGGQYGRPTLTGEKDVFYGLGQRSLGDF